jgi:hypothetical protein
MIFGVNDTPGSNGAPRGAGVYLASFAFIEPGAPVPECVSRHVLSWEPPNPGN